MTTKNIQDVVAEKVEKAIIRLAATGCFEGKGDKILQPYADWLTTTLTQLVKEVEVDKYSTISKMMNKLLHCETTQLVNAIYEYRDRADAKREALTPPTSDEEK